MSFGSWLAKLWCNFTGGFWNDGTEHGANGEVSAAGCEQGSSDDTGIGSEDAYLESLFPSNLDPGTPPPLFLGGSPMDGYGPAGQTGNGAIYYGGANPATTGGSTATVVGGTGASTPVYRGGAIWVMRWISDGDGCIVLGGSAGGDIGGLGGVAMPV